MQGRQFVIDADGKPSAVLLPIDEYRRLMARAEDAEDLALIESRRGEPDISIQSLEDLNALLAGD